VTLTHSRIGCNVYLLVKHALAESPTDYTRRRQRLLQVGLDFRDNLVVGKDIASPTTSPIRVRAGVFTVHPGGIRAEILHGVQ